ncbi:MAG: hypothetical protein KL863_09060 [Rhizobium sp.]|nr:hypothetical protein [Rhizobium sp.]
MTVLTVATTETGALRPLIERAATSLANAASAAEVLDARDQATLAYDAAKAAARFEKAKGAHDEIMASIYRSQADAAEIEFMAKRKLADEFDSAQARGEIAGHGGKRGNQHGKVDEDNVATTADLGLTRPQIHEARQIRDAIEAQPDLLRSVLDDMLQNGEEPTKAKVRKAIAPVVTTLRADATAAKKERRKKREITLAGRIRALPDKQYGVIWADPEWKFKPFSSETGMDRAADNHYPTSETEDICARAVPSIAAKDCVLFLWATAPMLLDALRVMVAWGFEYKTHMIWAKERSGAARGPGYWFSGEHELLLIGTRGNVVAPAMGEQWRSVISARVGEHSEKPEVFLEMVEDYFPNLPKIELNRRGTPRPGWDAWGAEVVDEGGPSATPREGGTIINRNLYDQAAEFMSSERLAGRQPNIGGLSRKLALDHDTAATLFDAVIDGKPPKKPSQTIKAAEIAPAPSLPPAPSVMAPVEFSVCGLRKNHATFSIRVSDDGRFTYGINLWLGYTGHSGSGYGDFATFADALNGAMGHLRGSFQRIIDDTSSVCAKSHKAAARAGLKWLDKQGDAWGLIARFEDAPPSPEPATIDLEEWIESKAAPAIPSPTEDELIEYKMLGAIEAGLVVGGDMFDAFVARGLVFIAGKIELSFDGSDRLAELDLMIKAHLDGDAAQRRSSEGGAT